MYELTVRQPDLKATVRTCHEQVIRDDDWCTICDVLGRILDNPEVKEVIVRKIDGQTN